MPTTTGRAVGKPATGGKRIYWPLQSFSLKGNAHLKTRWVIARTGPLNLVATGWGEDGQRTHSGVRIHDDWHGDQPPPLVLNAIDKMDPASNKHIVVDVQHSS
jgi:hypothetical protein